MLGGCITNPKSVTSPPATAETTNPPAAPPAQAANDPAKTESADTFDPSTATGTVKGVPGAGNSAPIEAVANYFTELPGIDLSGLDQKTREKYLHRVNSELCTCGCRNDTIAHCIVNDSKCPSVKSLAQKVLDEVKAGS